jgi:hypothetical protein
MDVFFQLLQHLGDAGVQLLINPFYYIAILYIVLQYRKQIQFERKLFHTRLHSLLNETWRTLLWGLVGGFAISFVMLFIGVTLGREVIALVWLVTLVMILARVRFLCLAYSAGVIGIAHVVADWIPYTSNLAGISWLLKQIANADIPSLLMFVAVLHLLEGILIGWQGARMATPLFLEGKRGKIIGGFQLQSFWPVPMFVLVPLQGASTEAIPWGTLLGAEFSSGWSLLAFPAMIGFMELTTSKLPRDQTRASSSRLILYGVLMFVLAAAAHYWSPLILVAAILSIALHEALVWYSSWYESKQKPLYVHSPRGLTVLSVIPGSPAAEMGIQTGEIIHKVNGQKINKKADLHAAMQLNAAFCKLEIVNLQGEIKFLQRALYSGEHHQLGIILAPDQEAMYVMEGKPMHLFTYLRNKLGGFRSNESGKPM